METELEKADTQSLASTVEYPFNRFEDLELGEGYRNAQQKEGLEAIQMPMGKAAWLATRYDDVRLVLGDKRFSRMAAHQHNIDDVPRVFPRIAGGIVMMDPPELSRLRKLAGQAFTTKRVEGLRLHVRALANQLIDRMLENDHRADLVADYALPIPISVICEMLGVPEHDQAQFRQWNDSLLSTSTTSAEQTQSNLGALSQYIMTLIQQRRDNPGDDLMTALMAAHDQDDHLSDKELVPLCIAILVAGYEGTASQIPNFIYTLLAHPEEFDKLKADPWNIDKAVEELLRFIPLASAAMFPHYAKEDIEVGGTLVKAGEVVFASIGAGNHDEHKFPSASTLNVTRDAKGHLAFGHGLHQCIGAALARIELQEALRALLIRLPQLRIEGEFEWKMDTFFRAPSKMEVCW